ncbi:MAG: hypothetical protein ACRDIZ_07565 [Actinomycetota bacterium]
MARSVVVTFGLLVRGRVRSPRQRVGALLTLPDGARSVVFRETRIEGPRRERLAVLIVEFRLRLLGPSHRFLHWLFRVGSVINTPLFAGFPGFRAKLWMVDVGTGGYRGLYQWDGDRLAGAYASALAKILRPLSVRGSVRYRVTPDKRLDSYVEALRHTGQQVAATSA